MSASPAYFWTDREGHVWARCDVETRSTIYAIARRLEPDEDGVEALAWAERQAREALS